MDHSYFMNWPSRFLSQPQFPFGPIGVGIGLDWVGLGWDWVWGDWGLGLDNFIHSDQDLFKRNQNCRPNMTIVH